DQGAVSAPATVTVHVTPGHTPILAAIDSQTVVPGVPLTFTASAHDPDGDPVTFSLDAGAPAGASIDPTTGAFSWTPTVGQAGQVYHVTVRASDSETPALSAAQSVVISVPNKLQALAVTEIAAPNPGPMQIAVDFNEALQPAAAQKVAYY